MQVLATLYLSNSILCLLLGLYFLLSTALNPLPARLLGLNYLLYAVQSLLAVLVVTFAWTQALLLRPLLALSLGPALYLYYLSVGKSEQRIGARHLLHFLPVAFSALVLVGHGVLWLNLDYLIIGSFTFYLGLAVIYLSKGESALSHLGTHTKTAYRWLCLLTCLMAINLLIEVLVLVEIRWGIALNRSETLLIGSGFFLAVNALTVLLALRRMPLIEWMHAIGDAQINRRLNPQLNETQARAIFEKFDQLVGDKQLYKKEGGVSVKQGARMLSIPARQLSESINRVYGCNFSQYLNDRRVKEARQLMETHPEIAITDLMLAAGFATKSNFNKEFSRVTNMSPSDYRKRLIFGKAGSSA